MFGNEGDVYIVHNGTISFHNHLLWKSWCFDWLANYKLQPITFNLCSISDLLVSTMYQLGLSLAKLFCSCLCYLDKDFTITFYLDEKNGHLDSHEGWLCPIISSSMLIIMNNIDIHTPQFWQGMVMFDNWFKVASYHE